MHAYLDVFDQSFQRTPVPESTPYRHSSGSFHDAETPRNVNLWSDTSSVSSSPTDISRTSSIFTTHPAAGLNTPTVYALSEAPSTQPHGLDPFDLYLLHASHASHATPPPQGDAAHPPSPFLPCEFSRYTGCPTTFPADELGLNQYIDHMSSLHLHHKLPPRCSCWWCDDFLFDANHPSNGGDRARNFYNRMAHIRNHVSDAALWGGVAGGGGGAAVASSLLAAALHQHRRPDFWMLDHLWGERLITREAYDRERGIREAPCPEGIYPAGWRPPVPERAMGVEDDLQKEERRRKRARGDGRTGRSRRAGAVGGRRGHI
ncbi:hypothetical protein SODALDRAFT_327948 [Sodiomyces alkalinus F11]|uniref:Uncharacterized protein n=1 Tax=Sodiomyces alkalinus (strain CBS 110278 / VKM F-3762 / F11) TaxID=1314773 RepID=A0A3N2QAE3_SODAK|nr:hypothetical protein SODALDRAFT_327948 [Sodiomyces alkalinus F11]ROT43733.1 hypothetical protein SODALDRAFT_327948 [Sodiomyces alkalinus F11]